MRPLAEEIERVRNLIGTILENLDEPTLGEDLSEQTVVISRGDLALVLDALVNNTDRSITQADRERACMILETWGGHGGAQQIIDAHTGAADDQDSYAGDLVRAFRDHRIG